MPFGHLVDKSYADALTFHFNGGRVRNLVSDMTQPLFGSWRRERWAGIACIFAVYTLYFPLTNYALSLVPLDVSTAFDHDIPLIPGWLLIYVMIYPAATLPLFVVKDPLVFRGTLKAFLGVELAAITIFLLLPVHMSIRPDIAMVPGDGFFEWGIRFCYLHDPPTCCLPSLHVATATLSGLACYRVHRPTGCVALLIAILISLSTLFVRQHFIADVLLGTGLALLFYFLWVHRAKALDDGELVHSRWLLLIPLGFFAVIVLGFYSLYLSA